MSYSNKESGFVSLFTVIFFMLLVTVITVSFLRIMITEQRQSVDNDLSANARAAAESGIEDGKRALLAYYNPATPADVRAELATAFGADSNNCDSLTSKTQIRTQLNITGQAVASNDLNQSYTCLNVKLNSPDYVDSSSANVSKVFPLRGVSDFNQIKVSWHLLSETVSDEADGRPNALAPNAPLPLLPPQTGASSWSSLGYPAYLRVQLLGYPNSGSFNRSDLDTRSRSVFLAPVSGGSATVIDLGTADSGHQFDSSKSSPSPFVQCSSTFTSYGSYLCTATLQLPAGLASNANNFSLRVTPIYGKTHFRVQLHNSSTNSSVEMNEVQPLIDSTGKSQDVFRRVQARVRLNPITSFPEFAAETTDDICKNMRVADAANSADNNCP
ncbi:MAG TPA: hypothetical protein VLA77_00245 [Candidatus Saccharimonadales bacterium]|nr:hypothetical protein [Candidatus Saccharimonadales bacterium]